MATTTDPSNHVSTTSLFNSLLEQSRKLRQETDTADLPAIQLGLGEIERRAKELKKTPAGKQADSRARYLLAAGGINADETLRDLDAIDFQTVYEPTAPVDTDINAYLRSRKDQSVTSSIEDGMRRTARDFDAFVAKNVTMEWDAQKQRILEHFGLAQKSVSATATPPQQTGFSGGLSAFGSSAFGRSRLSGSVGSGTTTPKSVWAKSAMNSSVLGKSMSRVGDMSTVGSQSTLFADVDPAKQEDLSRPEQARQQQYVQAIREMNAIRLGSQGPGVTTFPIMNAFSSITAASGTDMLTVQLKDCWMLLASIVGESGSGNNNLFSEPQEREFMKDYILNSAVDTPEAARVRKRVEKGSRKFLETQFREIVERLISDHPQIARVGGIPSVFAKFRGYINIKMNQNKDQPDWNPRNFEFVGDVQCWAMIFYLLRAGYVREADDYVRQNQQAFQKLDRGFATYLHAYAQSEDRRLPRTLHDRMQSEFNNRVRHMEDSKDPFKPAVYKIVGRCELAKRSIPNVMPTAEDWMWLQLVLSREIDRTTEPAHEVFTMQDLQKSVTQFGARHFLAKGSNVGLYFQMLLMCGLFEDAVHYLYSFHYVDGVHFAIALTYYGLLRPSSNPLKADAELLTLGAKGEKQINFPRLIGYYTNEFRSPNVDDSVDYLSLICLNGDLPPPSGPSQVKICHEALRELVLQTREFTTLLGNVNPDASKSKGAIEKRMRLIKLEQPDFLRAITEQAARQADDDGRATDAVLLYHLAEDYNTVVHILNKNLSDWIALDDNPVAFQSLGGSASGTPSSLSLASVDNPAQLADTMMRMYNTNAAISRQISPRNQEACQVLLRIAEAKSMFEEGRWEGCLNIIEAIDVIPLKADADVSSVRRKAQNFGALPDSISRNIGTLLKMAVECCSRMTAELRDSAFADASRGGKLAELKAKTKSAMIYAGMIQYKLPAHVYAYLNSRNISE